MLALSLGAHSLSARPIEILVSLGYSKYRETVSDGHKVFKGIAERLDLLLDVLRRIEEQAGVGLLNSTTKKVLLTDVGACHEEVNQLNRNMDKVMPNQEGFRLKVQASLSLRSDDKIQRIDADIIEIQGPSKVLLS